MSGLSVDYGRSRLATDSRSEARALVIEWPSASSLCAVLKKKRKSLDMVELSMQNGTKGTFSSSAIVTSRRTCLEVWECAETTTTII